MKPIISSFIFSDDVQQTNNPGAPGATLHIINPVNIVRPHYIPGSYSFAVAFGLIQVDPTNEHIINFQIKSPSGIIIVDTSEINVSPNKEFEEGLPLEAGGLMFNLSFRNVPLPEAGVYNAYITVDNSMLGEYPLHVYARGDI